MKKSLHIMVLLLITGYANILNAQFYVTGDPPASIAWKRIETDGFKIIFPDGMYHDANHYANLLEFYKKISDYPLSVNIRKIPVIIHSSSVVSNGYVTWAPKRMEIVSTPPQDSYAQDWLSQLALHEYQHVAQLNNLKSGFTHALSFVTGQIATGIASAMIPAWLYEGEAVLNETRFSNAGRGRMPGFEMPLRTLIIENQKLYSYDKAVFGSYRDFVPNHYQYGYQIVSYARNRFGSDIWSGAFKYTGRNMFLVSPLACYLKSNFGISKSQLYKKTMDSIKYQYNNILKDFTYTEYSTITKRISDAYTNYTIPRFTDGNHIIALKNSMDHLDKLVLIDLATGGEKEIATTGAVKGISQSASKSYVVWDEVVRDPRWGRRTYSEIRIYSFITGRIKSIQKRTRYFSPDIDASEKLIVAVETDLSNHHYLVILDVETGRIIKRILSADNTILQTPRWSGLNKIIVIVVSDQGKKIEEVDLENEIWKNILPYTWHNIAEPLQYKNYILFKGSYGGLENIFAVNVQSKTIQQLTSSRYGARHPEISPDSSRLVYSDYTKKGYDIVEISLDTNSWEAVEVSQRSEGVWFGEENEPVHNLTADIPEYQYEVKSYRKVLNFFNFHSWLPFYTDLASNQNFDDFQIKPGIMLFSQNLLGTSILTMGYTFSNGEHIFRPQLKWSGWYPVFEISGCFASKTINSFAVEDQESPAQLISNNSLEFKAYLPLRFTRGRFIKQLQPHIEYQHMGTSYSANGGSEKGIDYLHFRMYLYLYKRLSYRDLYPRLGSLLAFTYTRTPLNKNQFGDLYSMEISLYFPGIGKHHHLFFNTALQKQLIKEYYLPFNRAKFPRGYPTTVSKFISTVAANYAFPLFYPDFSIESILYVKRIKSNFFFDYAYGTDIMEHKPAGFVAYSGSYSSLGIELTADLHPLRFIFPITAGIRIGYMPLEKKSFTDFLISIKTDL